MGCPAAFATKEARAYHYRSAHEGRKFACTVLGCEMQFCSQAALRKHAVQPHLATLKRLKEQIQRQKQKIAKLKEKVREFEGKPT